MKFLTKRAARLQRGTTTVFFAFAMIPLVGVAAVALEFGNAAVHYKRLQNYVDSKAIAALREEFGNLPSDEQVEHSRFANGSATAGPDSPDETPEKGHWDFSVFDGAEQFTATPALNLAPGAVPAYRVNVDSFTVNLLFGSLFNVPSVDIRAEAVAYAPRRDIVIVQDVSGSMCSPDGEPCSSGASDATRIEQAKAAARNLVEVMNDQQIPGDRVGVVAFNGGIFRELPLTELSCCAGDVVDFLANLTAQGSTDLPTGLQGGLDLFNATEPDPEIQRTIILIGDGTGGEAGLVADAAEDLEIDVYTTLFCGDTPDPTYPCGSAEEDTFDELTRNDGTFEPTGSGPNLAVFLIDIVTGISMKLVR